MILLSHLTLNTGHLLRSRRAEVAGWVTDHLLPLVDAEGGPVPGLDGWHLDLMAPLDERGMVRPGAAYLQLSDEPGLSNRPVLCGFACWRPEMSDGAWQAVTHGYAMMQGSLAEAGLWRPPPPVAPAIPWLAVWMTACIVLADDDTLLALADLGRCIAWALIEGRP